MRVSDNLGLSNSTLHFELTPLFACHREGVQPDFLALAKGLTGGYLPMAATLTTQPVFDAFLGEYEEFKTFFHGHSYTGNQLGASAALASLEIVKSPESIRRRMELEHVLRDELQTGLAVQKTVKDLDRRGSRTEARDASRAVDRGNSDRTKNAARTAREVKGGFRLVDRSREKRVQQRDEHEQDR